MTWAMTSGVGAPVARPASRQHAPTTRPSHLFLRSAPTLLGPSGHLAGPCFWRTGLALRLRGCRLIKPASAGSVFLVRTRIGTPSDSAEPACRYPPSRWHTTWICCAHPAHPDMRQRVAGLATDSLGAGRVRCGGPCCCRGRSLAVQGLPGACSYRRSRYGYGFATSTHESDFLIGRF